MPSHPVTAPVRPRSHRGRAAVALVAATLALGACSVSIGSDASEDETPTTESTTTTEDTTTTEPAAKGPTLDDLEAILPTTEELGEGFTERETAEPPKDLRLGMIARCPDAVDILTVPEQTVSRTLVAPDGVSVVFELSLDQEPLTEAEETTLVDGLDACEIGVRGSEGTLHSYQWVASPDGIGDQAIRGGLTDSISSDAQPDPIGINTYFARVVVGDILIMVRGADGLVDGQRVPFTASEMAPITQEMVARVETLLE